MFKILVVEDDRELNSQVCTYLRQNGYEAVGCLNANDAFNTLYYIAKICFGQPKRCRRLTVFRYGQRDPVLQDRGIRARRLSWPALLPHQPDYGCFPELRLP